MQWTVTGPATLVPLLLTLALAIVFQEVLLVPRHIGPSAPQSPSPPPLALALANIFRKVPLIPGGSVPRLPSPSAPCF